MPTTASYSEREQAPHDPAPVPFSTLGLNPLLARGIGELGFKETRPIQSAVIPLAVGAAAAALAGVAAGLPAALSWAREGGFDLMGSGERSPGDRSTSRLRRALVAAQVALAALLLVCAGLSLRSFVRLATVDPGTGKATPIGEPLEKTVRIMALGPGPDGGLYASGVMENRLYRIDPQTGVFTEIGPFQGGKDVMDFATNPQDGAMYATTTTSLYRLDPKTAALTEVTRYVNVPPSVMGIVFDRDGTLYATNYGGESALHRIDPTTGRGERIAGFPQRNVHSADMKPGR